MRRILAHTVQSPLAHALGRIVAKTAMARLQNRPGRVCFATTLEKRSRGDALRTSGAQSVDIQRSPRLHSYLYGILKS